MAVGNQTEPLPDLRGRTDGHITLAEFLNELTQDQKVGSWRFNPEVVVTSKDETKLSLESYGGEVHTFTKVAEFGGGFVVPLNILSGNLTARPECLAPPSATNIFVPAGAEVPGPTLVKGETAKYQCCIHPWMRMTVKAPGEKN